MDKACKYLSVFLVVIFLVAACTSAQSSRPPSSQQSKNGIHKAQSTGSAPALSLSISRQVATPTVQPTAVPTPAPLPTSVSDPSPYGPLPIPTTEEVQLTQQLFALINSDRAARGLYPYQSNDTLAHGARLHSWNMYHCGFSHTCPDGRSQCQRIADEGFAGYTDCGENIGYAGPYPTPAKGVYNIQESMANEPPTGWHRIHLFSTTLHRVGVGVYVDPAGYIWFTEDLVS
jgi:uncharacterized protein YkwD